MIESSAAPKDKVAGGRTASAHVDTFCADSLPPRSLWPQMQCFGIPEFEYPPRMNCAVELLDEMVQRGHGERVAIHSYEGQWTYRQLLEKANKIAHVLVEDLRLVTGN